MKLSLIVAHARNGAIGRDGALPWRLPEDLAFFKRTTTGHPVIMGRKTWDSIGRPLPNRRNIVVTRDDAWQAAGATRAGSLADALQLCGDVHEAFVIGGGQVYAAALPLADAVIATEIARDVDGDAFFPRLDPAQWIELSREARVGPAPDAWPFAWVHYARRHPTNR